MGHTGPCASFRCTLLMQVSEVADDLCLDQKAESVNGSRVARSGPGTCGLAGAYPVAPFGAARVETQDDQLLPASSP
jgi:hypothetical protein